MREEHGSSAVRRLLEKFRAHIQAVRAAMQGKEKPDLTLTLNAFGVTFLETLQTLLVEKTHGHRGQQERVLLLKELMVGISQTLQEEIQYLAECDQLTGLGNARWFTRKLQEAFTAAQPDQYITVVVADVRNFARINSQFGHLAGSEALKKIALTLDENLRERDVIAHVARYGGDEYCMLLHGDSPQALAIVRRLVHAVDKIDWRSVLGRSPKKPPHIDIGLACIRIADSSAAGLATEVFQHADRLMYIVKPIAKQVELPTSSFLLQEFVIEKNQLIPQLEHKLHSNVAYLDGRLAGEM